MKAEDFMKALGGVSQEKLDALAQWQNAKTPVTGSVPAREVSAERTSEPPAKRRDITMKQHTQKKAQPVRLLPWRIGIGAAVVACAVAAVSIGREAIARSNQMQVGSNVGASVSEQLADDTSTQSAEQPDAPAEQSYEPVPLVEQLHVTGGSDYTMMPVPEQGAVQVLRSVEDAERCCQYADEAVAKDADDFLAFLTEDVFANYDVLYFAVKDAQVPLYMCDYQLTGGSVNPHGTILNLTFNALMYDDEHLPAHTLHAEDMESYWNTYYFYTVPKDVLPDLSVLNIAFSAYTIGEIPEDILDGANSGHPDKNAAFREYLENTQEYQDYLASIPAQKYITWEISKPAAPELPEDCAVAETPDTAQDTPQDITENPAHAPVPIQDIGWFIGKPDMEIPVGGAVWVIRSMDDAQPIMDALKAEYRSDGVMQTTMEKYFNESWLADHDIVFCALTDRQFTARNVSFGLHAAAVTEQGHLHMHFSAYDLDHPNDTPTIVDGEKAFWYGSVAKDTLPEITDSEITVTTYDGGALPEDVKADPFGFDDERQEYTHYGAYLESTDAFQAYMKSLPQNQENPKDPEITWE